MLQSKHQIVRSELFHQSSRSVEDQTVVMATKIALQAVVLSGGASRRMGRDKALLPHAAGGTWLEHITGLLNSLDLPVLVLTIHPSHEQLLQTSQGVTVQRDAKPGAGPLKAIAPVFPSRSAASPADRAGGHANCKLMAYGNSSATGNSNLQQPWPTTANACSPCWHLSGGSKQRQSMLETLAAGHNSWMTWLDQIDYRAVSLPPGQLRNCNHPNDDSRAID